MKKQIDVRYSDGKVNYYDCDDIKLTDKYILLEVNKEVVTIIGPGWQSIDINRSEA